MATRLDLGELLDRAKNPYAGLSGGSTQDLFQGLFDPGELYTGFSGPTNNPDTRSASNVLRKGGFAGLPSFDSLFGPGGNVKDPLGLLKVLNAGEVLSARPRVGSAFGKRYGSADDPLINDPIANVYNASTANRDLLDWLRSLGLDRGGFLGDVAFDPNNLRYTDFKIAPGLDLRKTNRAALEKFAQDLFGVDLETLASSPTKLLESRQKYLADPSKAINQADPATLNLTRIPGLSEKTFALRLQDYSNAITNARNIIGENRTQKEAGALLDYLRSNPEGLRTAFGNYLAGTQESRVGAAEAAQAAIPPAFDYSSFYQLGLTPDLMNLAASQAALKF